MNGKWKSIFSLYVLAVAGVAFANYFLFGSVFLSPVEIGLSPSESATVEHPSVFLTWPLFISTSLIVLVALIAAYRTHVQDTKYQD